MFIVFLALRVRAVQGCQKKLQIIVYFIASESGFIGSSSSSGSSGFGYRGFCRVYMVISF